MYWILWFTKSRVVVVSMEKQAPFVDLYIYVQKYWKGTKTFSACNSNFSHFKLLQIKCIILTTFVFIVVKIPANSLCSHKFRIQELKANTFQTTNVKDPQTWDKQVPSVQKRPCLCHGQRYCHHQPALGISVEGSHFFFLADLHNRPTWLKRWYPPGTISILSLRNTRGLASCSCMHGGTTLFCTA